MKLQQSKNINTNPPQRFTDIKISQHSHYMLYCWLAVILIYCIQGLKWDLEDEGI